MLFLQNIFSQLWVLRWSLPLPRRPSIPSHPGVSRVLRGCGDYGDWWQLTISHSMPCTHTHTHLHTPCSNQPTHTQNPTGSTAGLQTHPFISAHKCIHKARTLWLGAITLLTWAEYRCTQTQGCSKITFITIIYIYPLALSCHFLSCNSTHLSSESPKHEMGIST